MNESLIARLACPLCHARVTLHEKGVTCAACGQHYAVIDDIPNFLPERLRDKNGSAKKQQDLNEEMTFYEDLYKDLKGIDDGHCVVYGYEEIYDFIADVPRGTLLDVGCGAGHHSKDLAQRGFDVTGIDISINGLRQAKKVCAAHHQPVAFVLGDIENLPFSDKAFDVVFCSLILHHFPKREKLMIEIARVSKSAFVTFEVNAYDPVSFLRFNVLNPTIGVRGITKNQRTVSPRRLARELVRLGFRPPQTKFVDVHHSLGRCPRGLSAQAIRFYRTAAKLLPYSCRFNKFIMKCRRECESKT